MTNGAEEGSGDTLGSELDRWSRIQSVTCILPNIHTDEFVDRDPVQDIEGRVQFEWLTAPLTHEADLHGRARRLGTLHRSLNEDMLKHQNTFRNVRIIHSNVNLTVVSPKYLEVNIRHIIFLAG